VPVTRLSSLIRTAIRLPPGFASLFASSTIARVAEEAPALLTKGGLIGGAIILVAGLGTQAIIKGVKYMKNRKKMLEEKPNLEKQLAEQMEKASAQTDNSAEKPDDKEE
jgi:hypothetical protein